MKIRLIIPMVSLFGILTMGSADSIPSSSSLIDNLPSKEHAARASSVLNVVAGATAFIGSVCPIGCGRIMFVMSGVSWLAAGVANHATIDSGREDLAKIESWIPTISWFEHDDGAKSPPSSNPEGRRRMEQKLRETHVELYKAEASFAACMV